MVSADPSNAGTNCGGKDRTDADSATAVANEQPFGPHAAAILASEHWSLLAPRSLIWNEAMSRAAVFLTVLSASIIALALVADATGLGPHTIALALVLLPVVLLLGIATYVQINTERFQPVLAMNRLRRGYLTIAPGLEPSFTSGHHDDEQGLVTSYMLHRPSRARLWLHLLVNTPTIVATVDGALAAAIVVLVLQVAEAPRATLVAGGVAAFLVVWATLFPLQRHPPSASGHGGQVPDLSKDTPGIGRPRSLRALPARAARTVSPSSMAGASRGCVLPRCA